MIIMKQNPVKTVFRYALFVIFTLGLTLFLANGAFAKDKKKIKMSDLGVKQEKKKSTFGTKGKADPKPKPKSAKLSSSASDILNEIKKTPVTPIYKKEDKGTKYGLEYKKKGFLEK